MSRLLADKCSDVVLAREAFRTTEIPIGTLPILCASRAGWTADVLAGTAAPGSVRTGAGASVLAIVVRERVVADLRARVADDLAARPCDLFAALTLAELLLARTWITLLVLAEFALRTGAVVGFAAAAVRLLPALAREIPASLRLALVVAAPALADAGAAGLLHDVAVAGALCAVLLFAPATCALPPALAGFAFGTAPIARRNGFSQPESRE